MSANLDLVRSIYSAWERGDYSSAEWAHPDIEYVQVDGPTPDRSTGVAEMGRRWGDFLSAWHGWSTEAVEYREVDQDRVFVLTHFSGRGRTSGLELGKTWANGASLFHIHGGEVTKLVLYLDADRALADLGLPPDHG